MQTFETSDSLHEDLPNKLFFHEGAVRLMFTYLLEDISVVCVLHDYTRMSAENITRAMKKTRRRKLVCKRQHFCALTMRESELHSERSLSLCRTDSTF